MGRIPCETDFVDKNTNTSQNMVYAEYKNAVSRVNEETRIHEAAKIREQIREEKSKKMQFDAVKWELYRLKISQIEEKYAEFKKRQKKI